MFSLPYFVWLVLFVAAMQKHSEKQALAADTKQSKQPKRQSGLPNVCFCFRPRWQSRMPNVFLCPLLLPFFVEVDVSKTNMCWEIYFLRYLWGLQKPPTPTPSCLAWKVTEEIYPMFNNCLFK
jgi:hypothetical protein